MNINFDKTDRLIELIEDSCHVFTHFSWQSENSLQKKRKQLYETLVKITGSDKPDEKKHAERIVAFAKEYNLGKDLTKAEAFLKLQFDEENILQYLTRAYWQIQNIIIFTDNTGSNFTDREGLKKFIEKQHPNEPCKDVVIDVVCKQEPRIKDIEQEFWSNCTDTNKINDFCNIYRERWHGHLKKVDEKYYSMDALLFDVGNELHHYFKELRLCGMLQQSELYFECRLMNIARQINYLSDDVVKLFTTLRSSTKRSMDEGNINDNEVKWDNSTWIIYHYYIAKSKGKELTEYDIINCANDENLNKKTLLEKWNKLREDAYKPGDFTNQKKQFRKNYELILSKLSKDNQKLAATNVQSELDILMEVHKVAKK